MDQKYNRKITIRILMAIVMLISVAFGYWWLTWGMAIALLFYFPIYYEIIIFGIMYDALYGLPISEFWNIRYIFTISSIILFTISFYLRKILIVYNDKH